MTNSLSNDLVSLPPLLEVLFHPELNLSKTAGMMTTASAHVSERRLLRERLERVAHGPIDWSCATSRIQAIELYESLNALLSTGNDDRFILYCPTYLIPKADWFRQYDDAVDTFSELYLKSWDRLLYTHDVKANFIDGDVPDAELKNRPMERVVQAAYLTPTLLSKGLITENTIAGARLYGGPLLDKSFQESRIGLDIESDYIFNLSKPFRDSVAAGLTPRINFPPEISSKRANWLNWEQRRKTLQAMGNSLGKKFQHNSDLTLSWIGTLDHDSTIVKLLGMGSAIESDIQLYQRFRKDLLAIAKDPDFRDYASMVFCRLYSIGAIESWELEELGFFYPNLAGPFHSNLSVIEKERAEIREILAHDQELSEVIYQTAMVFGSRLKGYGGPDSDIDFGVFVRPGVKDIDYVSRLLRAKFGKDIVQWWLEEDGPSLKIRDFTVQALIGRSTDAHILFGGAWEGDLDTISMLCQKLLGPYVNCEDPEKRRIWLEEMERDTLQYRLLHRGYERYNVPTRSSIFWDEGYREVASKLYSSHVFLPTGISDVS